MSAVAVVKLYVVDVALVMLAHKPPGVNTCHCTLGVGMPVAVAVKLAVAPDMTVLPVGCNVTKGDGSVRVTAVGV